MRSFLILAAVMQACAVLYGFFLLNKRQGAAGAWVFLLGAMLSMLAWRVAVLLEIPQPPFFNPAIAIWGSTCMFAAMFLFGREVERRRRAEAERDSLLESERVARGEAERASRAKDDFLATVSHELRTPLAAILGWCEVARHERTTGTDKERAVETIERNARAQSRLIDDLLDLSRLRVGALGLHLDRVALDGPVRAAVQGVRPAADAKNISIDTHFEESLPLIAGDTERLQQIASNLLVNAAKFTPPGGRIAVRVSSTPECVELVVSDTGEGISADFLPQLFTRFRQADSSPARRHGGLGLGLSIVSSLVKLHGGTVSAASDGIGKGATFTVSFPRVASDANDDGRPVAAIGSRASLQGIRLLIVDDEQDVREAVAAILQRNGALVRSLAGPASLEAELAAFRPQVLLMDISMPGEDGYTALSRIRKLPAERGGTVPAISITAHARNEDRARALAAGFQNHLSKPIDYPTLLATVQRLAV